MFLCLKFKTEKKYLSFINFFTSSVIFQTEVIHTGMKSFKDLFSIVWENANVKVFVTVEHYTGNMLHVLIPFDAGQIQEKYLAHGVF